MESNSVKKIIMSDYNEEINSQLIKVRLSQWEDSYRWIVDCPFCKGEHIHDGGLLSDDPYQFLRSAVAPYIWPKPKRKGPYIIQICHETEIADFSKKEIKMDSESLREIIANECHQQWIGWMLHLFSKCHATDTGELTIPATKVKRWREQMYTPYTYLPEEEKVSGRGQADRIINRMEAFVDEIEF